MTQGLVLGGGGPVGIAWEIGIVAGLAEGGIDVTRADQVIGTSAGAVVGALLAAGRPPRALYEELRARREPPPGDPVGAAELQPLFAFMLRRRSVMYAEAAMLQEMGAFALAAKTPDEATFLARVGDLLPPGAAWPDRFSCTAVDATTGGFRVWDKRAGVDLVAAVASSCAVPGVFPPITIGGSRFIDGGMRSPTNADLAAGCDRVLMLAVTLPVVAGPMLAAARGELDELAAAGRQTALVVPDAACHVAFGPDLLDATRMAPVLEAAIHQGRTEAARLGPIWNGNADLSPVPRRARLAAGLPTP